MDEKIEISVIISVSRRYDDVLNLYHEYKRGVEAYGRKYEFIYVLDGEFGDVLEHLKSLQSRGESIKIIKLAKKFGETTALTAGFEHASGDIFLTLPAHYQVEPSEIPKILKELQGYGMVIGRRWLRIDSRINRLQTYILNSMINLITGNSFHDLGCGVRAFRRQVALEVPIYGDQHRFFPVLVSHRGFRVKEVNVTQSAKDGFLRLHQASAYPRHILDIIAVFFLIRFTKKPLRFFGLTGVSIFTVGALLLLYIVIERLFFGVGLSERPALLLSSLIVVLGVQVTALGLIGELIIFAHAKDFKEYTIEEIIN